MNFVLVFILCWLKLKCILFCQDLCFKPIACIDSQHKNQLLTYTVLDDLFLHITIKNSLKLFYCSYG